ncbi:hypothetical protein [Variovorax sp. UMC13]|uniref:hypothetical protein n=1 Tax=Variovorax sp. UMC13 TaxID=1862326 RepID=UPI0015FFDE34|nr:hypothetical protein [Variovorax sp. UMC13]
MNAVATKPRAAPSAAQATKMNPAQGVSKPLLSLVSDVRHFQGVEGRFSPFAGPDSLTFGGSLLGLANSHRVNVPDLKEIPEDSVTEATDEAGHTWYIRCNGGWLITAFRELTAQEIEERNERWEDSLLSGIPKNRVMTCRRIAVELMVLAEAMSPDRCPPRSARRLLKQQMLGLARVQFDLLHGKSAPMSEIRTRMKALGFECPY